MNRYSPYYDPDEQRVRMTIDAEGSWVHVTYADKLWQALALAEVEVALERSWCRVCRTEGRGEYRGRAEHPHERRCLLYRGALPARADEGKSSAQLIQQALNHPAWCRIYDGPLCSCGHAERSKP